jgi:hypothetical protein
MTGRLRVGEKGVNGEREGMSIDGIGSPQSGLAQFNLDQAKDRDEVRPYLGQAALLHPDEPSSFNQTSDLPHENPRPYCTERVCSRASLPAPSNYRAGSGFC